MLAHLTEEEMSYFLRFEPQIVEAEVELPAPIHHIVQTLGVGVEAELVRSTFTSLLSLLAELHEVEGVDVIDGFPVGEAVAAFASVHGKAAELGSQLEDAVPQLDEPDGNLGSALLDVSFALRHEVWRAFELDIARICGERPIESAEGLVAHAHGMLKNCFRQCVGLLAQSFDPSLSERNLFADAHSRQQESVILLDALAELLTSIKESAKKSFPQSAVKALDHLDVFRHESMPYLMRRDWEMFDAFENELVATKNEKEFEVATERLLVGLETLLAQVQMRAAFNNDEEMLASAAAARLNSRFARALNRVRSMVWPAVTASLIFACVLAFFADTTLEIKGSEVAAKPDAGSAPQSFLNTTAAQSAQLAEVKEAAKAETPAKQSEQKSSGGLTLQIAAYNEATDALESAARLKTLGVAARVAEARKGGQVIYRVQAGSFTDSGDAARFGKQLRAKGIAQDFIITKAS